MTKALQRGDDFVQATIPIRYVAEMLASAGDRAPAILREIGLPDDALEQDGFRVSGDQAARLHHALARQTDDELYGHFRRPVPRGTFAAFVRQATGYRDLRSALAGAIDWYGLLDGHAPWSLTTRGRVATLRLRPRTAKQRTSLLYSHTMLLSAWRTASWLGDELLSLGEIALDRRFAAYVPQTRFLFGAEPSLCTGACLLRFEAALLDLPVRRDRAAAIAWTETASFAAMLGRPPRGSLQTRVRTELARLTPVADAALPEVARRLGMSKQTLARRLRERGLTFRELKDAVRRDHAVALLSRGIAVAEVATELGFSEPSAFTRAFKTWTGTSPGRYRRADP